MPEDVVRRHLVVRNPLGLHARPAARIVEVSHRFVSQIELIKGSQRVNAKSIMEIMTLAAEQGTLLIVETKGPDAADAVTALDDLFARDFCDAE